MWYKAGHIENAWRVCPEMMRQWGMSGRLSSETSLKNKRAHASIPAGAACGLDRAEEDMWEQVCTGLVWFFFPHHVLY